VTKQVRTTNIEKGSWCGVIWSNISECVWGDWGNNRKIF